MSGIDPMEFNAEPYATNTLVMKRYLAWYILILWVASLLPLYMVADYFFVRFPTSPILYFCLLPLFVLGVWVVFVCTSIAACRILLWFVNLCHNPREGVFFRSRKDKDYRYWSLRATIKKFAFWAAHLFPLPWLDILAVKALGVKTRLGTTFFNAWIDSEFIEVGKNSLIGIGAVVLSAVVIGEHFIIQKVKIGNDVLVGAHSFVAPGTKIGDNAILGAMSSTSIGQELEPNWVYVGIPSKKFKENKYSIDKNFKGRNTPIDRETTSIKQMEGVTVMMTYGDGSGNSYVIRDEQDKTLEYNPVKPEFSSSGVYDGGTYLKTEISEVHFAQIRSVLNSALTNPAIHIKSRTKGSGFITIQESGKSTSCILSPGSPEQKTIESLLKKVLQGE